MQPFREVECERLTQRNVEVATELDDRSSVLHTNREEKNKILTIGTIASVISLHREVGERTKPFAVCSKIYVHHRHFRLIPIGALRV